VILKAYEGKNIPLEYAKKEAESKRQFIEEWKARGGGKVRLSTFDIMFAANNGSQGLSSGGFTVSSLFSSNTEKVSTLNSLIPSPFKLLYSPSPRTS
jgi:mitochondrial import inner membrane translocase subunit TIM50